MSETATSGRVTLKIATITPNRSILAARFKAAASEIDERTYGRVVLRFYLGGIQGTERQVQKKIKAGRLHGGTFLPAGFQALCPNLSLYHLFFTFESQGEVDYVRQRLDARMIRCLEEAGFVSFGFAGQGFALLMSNVPVQTYSDLDNLKLWVPEGDGITDHMARALNMSPVSLPGTDVLTALATGLLDAVTISPELVVMLYWHTRLKYVTQMNVSYSMSFMAVDANAFNRIDPIDQAIVRGALEAIYAGIDRETREEAEEALTKLIDLGIERVQPDRVLITTIREIAAAANAAMANEGLFSAVLYYKVLQYIEEYRTASTIAGGAP